jgi:Transposase, Mutator family
VSQLGGQGRVSSQQLLQPQLPGSLQGPLGVRVTAVAGQQDFVPQFVQLGPDAVRFLPVPGAQFEQTLASASLDLLREMVRELAQRMMDAEVEARCGAGYGEVRPDRVNSRNGYRRREWDTRAGTMELAIPKLRQGSYFPLHPIHRQARIHHANPLRGRRERAGAKAAGTGAASGTPGTVPLTPEAMAGCPARSPQQPHASHHHGPPGNGANVTCRGTSFWAMRTVGPVQRTYIAATMSHRCGGPGGPATSARAYDAVIVGHRAERR